MLASIELWALPLNTALLIVLALTNSYIARSQHKERRDVIDVKQSLGLTKRGYDHPHNGNQPPDTGERRRSTDHPD